MLDLVDVGQQCVGKRFIVLKSDGKTPPFSGGLFPAARPLGATPDGGSIWQYRADHLLSAIRRTPIPQENLKLKAF
jgi:hypothetical protein